MTVNAVRLNHAVLFVADLERSIAFYERALGMTVMAREPRANAAFLRLPLSGNHHDLGLFGVGAQPAASARRPRPLPPRVAGRHARGPRPRPGHPGRARRARRRVQPRGHQERLRAPTRTATSSRSCGWCPARIGASTRTPPRSTRLDLDADLAQWPGLRTAHELNREVPR